MEALRDSCSPRPCPLPTPTLLGIRAGIPKWSQSSTAGFHSGRTGRAVFILNHATAQGKRSAGPDLHYPWQARGACAWLPAWVTLSLHWGLTLTHWPPHSASKVSPLCVDEALTVAPRAQPSGPCLPPQPPPFQTSPSLHSGLSLQLQDQSWFSQGLLSSVPGTRSLRSLYRLFQPPAPQRRHHLLGKAHPDAH